MSKRRIWKLSDVLRFLQKMTWRKGWNAIKLMASYYLSKWSGRPVHWGQVMALSIEPTTACNLRCPECPSGLRSFTRGTGNLKADFFRKTLDQVADSLVSLTFYFQGEPFINPSFLNMVRYAHDRGIYTVTSTNGHFLSEEVCQETVASGLDRIIISIDGTSQEVYEQYRKEGNLEEVLAGSRRLVKARQQAGVQHPYLIFQFLVVRPNEHQIDEVYRLAEEIGVDEVKLKTAQLYDYQQGNPLMPTQEKYARYREVAAGHYVLKGKMTDACWKMWHSAVVTWNGIVVPCCFDKDAQHQLGNLRENTFEEVWNGEGMNTFRKTLFQGRRNIDICENCTEGCQIWA